MLITNATKVKLRFSVIKDKSDDETYEAFAYLIASRCSLDIPEDNYSVSIESDQE